MNKAIQAVLLLGPLLCQITPANAQTITGDQIRDGTVAEVKLDVANSPTTNYVFSWNGVRFEWQPAVVFPHTDLTDMPSAINADHDGRYYTQAEVEALIHWIRTGTVLSPKASGDTLEIAQTSNSGNALRVYRNLASGDTDSPVVEINQVNIGDVQNALAVAQAGSGRGISSVSVTGVAVFGASASSGIGVQGTSIDGHGVEGSTGSGDNDVYGLKSTDRTKVGTHADFDNIAAATLAAAPTNNVRVGAIADLMYATDDGTLGQFKLSNHEATNPESSNYTAVTTDDIITMDASGGARTIALFTAVGNGGRRLTLIKTDATANIVTIDPDGSETINGALTYQLIIENESITIVNDGANWYITASNTHKLIDLSSYIDIKTRNNPEIHGANVLEVSGAVNPVGPLPVVHGQGRLMFVVNAGIDTTGTITITGTSVDRDDSQSETPLDTEAITIAGLTTDNTTTDVLGATVWDFQDCYMSTKWWQGIVILSTADVDIFDIDVYLVNFDQFGDHHSVIVESLEIEGFKTNTSGAMSAHLYSVIYTGSGNKYDLQSIADLEHTAAKTEANTRVKMRVGEIDVVLDGTTDGIFLTMQLDRINQPDWRDVTTRIHAISLCDPG